jgi:hypothetical protein
VKTPIFVGAKARLANQDKFISVVQMTPSSRATHAAIKSALYMREHGTKARRVRNTIIVRPASRRETKQRKKKQVEPL